MILTKEILDEGRSNNGGFGSKQLKLLGVEWPPPTGWANNVIGQEYEQEILEKFVDLKNKHFKKYYPKPPYVDKRLDYAIWKDKD